MRTVARIIKWVSIPVLLIAGIFSCAAASYETLVNVAICICAIYLLQRALWSKEYFRVAGFGTIVVLVSPMAFELKVFMLMAFACMGSVAAVLAGFRKQTVEPL